ncbi:potassium efflux system protein [Allochromatium warmingii]|uniref:Potassium efflux system protein n=1 Tax=Allochromatium warmingii TaxID=61595 RepID=A0A1H3GYT0_ALLWA|nr:mechanosensitive ion channel domain-containing protein [Allochromatium warmingii]SDY08442.1 potassium efflux system protein [Allochromatium warmingii]
MIDYISSPLFRLGAVLLVVLSGLSLNLYAQDAASTSSSRSAAATSTPLPTQSQIEAQIKLLEASTSLDETLKSSLIELYRRALVNVSEIEKFDARRTELADALKAAPKQTQALQKTLERETSAGSAKPPKLPTGLTSDQLSQRLNQAQAETAAQELRVNELNQLIDASQRRPEAARERLIVIKQALDAQTTDTPPLTDDAPELTQAQAWAAQTQRQALQSEMRMLEQELLSQPASLTLLKLQHDLAALHLRDLRVQQRALEEALSQQRAEQAQVEQQAAERAQREAEDKHPLVREWLQHNAALTAALSASAQQLSGLSEERARVEAERKRIEDDYRGAKQRLEVAGLTRALGQVLLDQRNQLPDQRQYRHQINARENAIADATLRQIRHREEDRQLRDLDRYLDELALSEPAVQARGVRPELLDVLKQRQNLLRQVIKSEDDSIHQLSELNYAAEQVVQAAQIYEAFLAENLLWVRSATVVNLDTLTNLPAALGWLVSLDGGAEVVQVLNERIRHSPLFWLGLALNIVLIALTPRARRAIRARAEPLRRVRTDSIRLTLEALGLTLLIALPAAYLFWLLGQQLMLSPLATPYTRALGAGLSQVAFGLYCLRVFRLLALSSGVAEKHFRWKLTTLTRLRRDFGWFTLYVVPLALMTGALYQYNDPAHTHSLGRVLLIACLIGTSVFFARLLHPSQGAIKQFLLDHPHGWLYRLRSLWFPLIVGIPLALAVLAAVGYLYTAAILFQSLVYQLWLVLGLIVAQQTVVRWLSITRRRIALQAALERQAARRAQAEHEPSERSDTSAVPEVFQVDEAEPDLAALDEQTRHLINAAIFMAGVIGLWATWSEVLPAFSVLERFALWHYSGVVNGAEQLIPVTVADIGMVILIVAVATIAARNLPALLEILLLQSNALSAGARYTIKTLSSYLITTVAFLLAFNTLGMQWGQIQWLVAALGVGIGFGLQEIIGNFISGLIILFERPVRVGDIVTIGDTTGVVTNIRIRATTIRNWDRQELLVPNKEFITGRLLNWTLTDQQNRISIPIGIEYGSDTRKALELLGRIANEHERVLDDPAPLVSFEGFGDNALLLMLRCYMDSLDGRIGVVTELNQTIYDTFAAEGIPMAFPQREVRLHTHEPLDVRLHSIRHNAEQRSRPSVIG